MDSLNLPHGDNADVSRNKLEGYVLNPLHPDGQHKARVFLSALGISSENADLLRAQLLQTAREGEATERGTNEFGTRYEIVFEMTGPNGKSALVTSGWFIDSGGDTPRLTSCYVRL